MFVFCWILAGLHKDSIENWTDYVKLLLGFLNILFRFCWDLDLRLSLVLDRNLKLDLDLDLNLTLNLNLDLEMNLNNIEITIHAGSAG